MYVYRLYHRNIVGEVNLSDWWMHERYHSIAYAHSKCPLEIGPPNYNPPILEKKSKILQI